jgi:MSHA pilin protein MshD
MSSSRRQRGLSLIEVVVFIVVVGIAVAGMAVIYNQMTLASVDPLVRKQAVAIANSLMEEIQLRPFTYCDPDDPLVFTETSKLGCSSAAMRESALPLGPETGETRYGPTQYDNVSDYNGFSMSGSIQDIGNNTIPGLAGYTASIVVEEASGAFPPGTVQPDDALSITITVTGPGNVRVVLQGYRLRYAPNSP